MSDRDHDAERSTRPRVAANLQDSTLRAESGLSTMHGYVPIDSQRPLAESEIEAAVGIFGGPTIDDPATDLGADLGPLPTDAEEWAAPPPDAP